MLRKLVLNVDDNDAARYAKTRTLINAGFSVEEAASGGAALEKAIRLKPALLLLDVKMPDLDGYEVCRRLKADPLTSGIPVVHISAAWLTDDDERKALLCGADRYLRVPLEPSDLVAHIRHFIKA